MQLRELRLLADEAFDAVVVAELRREHWDIQTVHDVGLAGRSDEAVLEHAHRSQRVVLTFDADFGRLVIGLRMPFIGVVFVRPGHIDSEFTLASLREADRSIDVARTPFLRVIERRSETVAMRLRYIESAT